MMEYLKEYPNTINDINDYDSLQSLIYTVNNCRSASIEWSLDGKYLKINYWHFYKEYLRTIPIICKSVFDFVNIMEFCGFKCVNGPCNRNAYKLIFVKLENCDKIIRPSEYFGRYHENTQNDNTYEKNYCETYPYMYENDELEPVGNPYTVYYNESPTFRAVKSTAYQPQTETSFLRKRNRRTPARFSDNFTKVPEINPNYSTKTPPFYKVYKKREENDSFEKYGNQCSVNETNTGFTHAKGFKFYRERKAVTIIEGNKCLRSQLTTSITEMPTSDIREVPSPHPKYFEKKCNQNNNFDQFQKQHNFFCQNNSRFHDNRSFKYINNAKTKNLREKCNCFSSGFKSCNLEIPKQKRDHFRETPSLSSKEFQEKIWQGKDDLEQFENQINFPCNSTTKYSYDKDYRYRNKHEIKNLKNINDCFRNAGNVPENIEKKTGHLSETLSSHSNICEKNWTENGDFELLENKCNVSCKNISDFDDNKSLKCNKEIETKPVKDRNRYFPSNFRDTLIEIPGKKLGYLRKSSLPRSNNLKDKVKENDDFDKFKIQARFSRQSVSESGNDKDYNRNNEPETKSLRKRTGILPSHFNDYVINIPRKKQSFWKKAPSSVSGHFQKKRKKRLSNHYVKNIFHFSKCALFKNPDFTSKLMHYNEVDSDNIFLKETSRDIMLCFDYESEERLIITEERKADDHISMVENDSVDAFLKETVEDIMMRCDCESEEREIITEDQPTVSDIICLDDSVDASLNKTGKDIVSGSECESDDWSIITKDQKADDDVIYICDCPPGIA